MRRGHFLQSEQSDSYSLSTTKVPSRRRRVLGPSKMTDKDEDLATHDSLTDVAKEKKVKAGKYTEADVKEVKEYQLVTEEGKPIRKATKVVFKDGTEVEFLEKMPKNQAIRRALGIKGGKMDKKAVVQELVQIARLLKRSGKMKRG